MNQTDNPQLLHEIRHALRLASHLRVKRQARYDLWLKQGEGQLFCYVYLPKYPKELYEVLDWQPVQIADPSLRKASHMSSVVSAEEAQTTRTQKDQTV